MSLNVEYFILFYKIGVVITIFICLYEYLFEMYKVRKIKNKFTELGINENVINIILALVWVLTCLSSWFYVGKKISNLINKIDTTKDL